MVNVVRKVGTGILHRHPLVPSCWRLFGYRERGTGEDQQGQSRTKKVNSESLWSTSHRRWELGSTQA